MSEHPPPYCQRITAIPVSNRSAADQVLERCENREIALEIALVLCKGELRSSTALHLRDIRVADSKQLGLTLQRRYNEK